MQHFKRELVTVTEHDVASTPKQLFSHVDHAFRFANTQETRTNRWAQMRFVRRLIEI